MDLILTPAVAAATAKKIAIIIFQNRDCAAAGKLNYITITNTNVNPPTSVKTDLNVAMNTKSNVNWSSDCVGALIPVQPGKTIEINATINQDAGGHRGFLYMMVEK
jgi:hypothetical protein